MVYLKSVENVITLGKLIGLLFLFCLPLLSILFLKTKRNDLTLPVMGTIFLVYWKKAKLEMVCLALAHKTRMNSPDQEVILQPLNSTEVIIKEREVVTSLEGLIEKMFSCRRKVILPAGK